jgi:hypothetical protein
VASFLQVWKAHPSNWPTPEPFPCKNGKGEVASGLKDQCAIRLGIAFQGGGVNTDSMSGARCWSGHGKQHILRVNELAPWIDKNATRIGCGKRETHKKVTFLEFVGRKGIVCFQNFWGPGNRGDHIDLWNGFWMGQGAHDYFIRSQEVWFWEMK